MVGLTSRSLWTTSVSAGHIQCLSLRLTVHVPGDNCANVKRRVYNQSSQFASLLFNPSSELSQPAQAGT
jgi:hypothetical protein